MAKYKNVLTSDFYNFLMSNRGMYSSAVFNQIYDAQEANAQSQEEKERLAVVLSGFGNPRQSLNLKNHIERIIFSMDSIARYKFKIRFIDNKIYDIGSHTDTDMFPSPLDSGLTEADRQNRISFHPDAFSVFPASDATALSYGTIIMVRQEGEDFFVIENISKPLSMSKTSGTGTSTEGKYRGGRGLGGGTGGYTGKDKYGEVPQNLSTPELNRIALKHNLRPRVKKYYGKVTAWHGKKVLNGLPHSGADITGLPSKTNWEPAGSGHKMLVDYHNSFELMAAAYQRDLGEKLKASCYRSFEQQLKNRRKGAAKSGDGLASDFMMEKVPGSSPVEYRAKVDKDGKKIPRGCSSVSGGKCMTAIPGRSNHGFAQAIDIRPYYSHSHYHKKGDPNPFHGNGGKWKFTDKGKLKKKGWAIGFDSEHWKWMMKNAQGVDPKTREPIPGWEPFGGITWAYLGQKGTCLKGQAIEPWHWEPCGDQRVIK